MTGKGDPYIRSQSHGLGAPCAAETRRKLRNELGEQETVCDQGRGQETIAYSPGGTEGLNDLHGLMEVFSSNIPDYNKIIDSGDRK